MAAITIRKGLYVGTALKKKTFFSSKVERVIRTILLVIDKILTPPLLIFNLTSSRSLHSLKK